MDGREFWERVHADKRMEWLGCLAEGEPDPDGRRQGDGSPPLCQDTVYVVGLAAVFVVFAIPMTCILGETWELLRDIILGVRNAMVLSQITRVVGYFSNLKNWNRSKIAENNDRRKAQRFLFGGTGQTVLCGSPKRSAECGQ